MQIEFQGLWINLEAFILDDPFLNVLQTSFTATDNLCGYGAGTDCLSARPVAWDGRGTHVQKTAIVQDFGLFGTLRRLSCLPRTIMRIAPGCHISPGPTPLSDARVRAFRAEHVRAQGYATLSQEEIANAA